MGDAPACPGPAGEDRPTLNERRPPIPSGQRSRLACRRFQARRQGGRVCEVYRARRCGLSGRGQRLGPAWGPTRRGRHSGDRRATHFRRPLRRNGREAGECEAFVHSVSRNGGIARPHVLQHDARRDRFADSEASLRAAAFTDDRRSPARPAVLPDPVELEVGRCEERGAARPGFREKRIVARQDRRRRGSTRSMRGARRERLRTRDDHPEQRHALKADQRNQKDFDEACDVAARKTVDSGPCESGG